jgi:transposase
MDTKPSPAELEARRRLAVRRVLDGYSQKDVAAFLGVTTKAVGNWVAAYREHGDDGLAARPRRGAKPKLTPRQERAVLSWLAGSPKAFGYQTDLWTTRRLAEQIAERYGVRFNSNYLAEWLTRRGHTPQKPAVRAVERDEPAIARWVAEEWPRLKRRRGTRGPTSS